MTGSSRLMALATGILVMAAVAQANGEPKPVPKTSTGRELTGPGAHPGEYQAQRADTGRDTGRVLERDTSRTRVIPERMEVDSLRGPSGPTRPEGPTRPTSPSTPREPVPVPDGGRGSSPRPTPPTPGTPGP